MIVLNVTYRCKAGKRDAFLEAVRTEGIDAATRAETGCLKYDYYLPACESDELFLLEKWTGPDAVKAHGGQAHMEKLGALKKEYVEETVIEKFEVRE